MDPIQPTTSRNVGILANPTVDQKSRKYCKSPGNAASSARQDSAREDRGATRISSDLLHAGTPGHHPPQKPRKRGKLRDNEVQNVSRRRDLTQARQTAAVGCGDRGWSGGDACVVGTAPAGWAVRAEPCADLGAWGGAPSPSPLAPDLTKEAAALRQNNPGLSPCPF